MSATLTSTKRFREIENRNFKRLACAPIGKKRLTAKEIQDGMTKILRVNFARPADEADQS